MFKEDLFQDVAQSLNCHVAAIQAVASVESDGKGFTPKGKLKILFEGHLFFRQTNGKFAKSHPSLCYRKQTNIYYRNNYDDEYTYRFSAAFKLDKEAAMMSCSWGAFQILGEHYTRLGFDSVGDYIDFLKEDINNHLVCFARFIETDPKLKEAMQKCDWATFARIYNGPNYKKNNYDVRIALAYKKFLKAST